MLYPDSGLNPGTRLAVAVTSGDDPAMNRPYHLDVRACGALGDGVSLDTQAVQAAIDRCAEGGGGTVLVPAGRFLCGSLQLRSRVGLHLAAGATILGSRNPADYSNAGLFRDAVGADRGHALIRADGQEEISITGSGTIDGQGASHRPPVRPMILRFTSCRRVNVDGVVLRDSAAWVQHYVACDDMRLNGVSVHSRSNHNNDGLNLDGCQRVRVSDCLFDSGDDALTLKSTTPQACRDIVISNCIMSSACNALKFGTESIGGFQNVAISNCVIHDTRLCGITVASVDGALIDNVIISGITMRNVGEALLVRLGSRGYHMPKDASPRPCGHLRNLIIRDVIATGTGGHGSAILGLPDHPIEDVCIENMLVTGSGGGQKIDAIEEGPAYYPQYDQWGGFPAHGLYCRHVRGLQQRNLRFRTIAPDPRPPVRLDDVS